MGHDNWDMLYTDYYPNMNPKPSQPSHENNMKHWRPNASVSKSTYFAGHRLISKNLARISQRILAHSIIFRRSGIKKILDFEKERGLFLIIDEDYMFVPHLKIYSLMQDVVSATHLQSFTNFTNE